MSPMTPNRRRELNVYIDQILAAECPRRPEHIRSTLIHCSDETDIEATLKVLKHNCKGWFRV